MDEMEAAFDPDNEALYHYNWRESDQQEQGWLVIADGKIDRKYPIAGNRKKSVGSEEPQSN